MFDRVSSVFLFSILLLHGCPGSSTPVQLKYQAVGSSPQILAVYEAWFGERSHIQVGYSSADPDQVRKQIDQAKQMGISGFVVDWYGDRDMFVDKNYAIVQKQAAKEHFQVAMMYDQSQAEDGATDEVIADLTMFHNAYLASGPGHRAYLTYLGRPVIFVFPHGNATDWDKVRQSVNQWKAAPFLIDENLPGKYAADFDGFYPWINPGPRGWAPDGSHWGEAYLSAFYQTMVTKFPDKIIVGGAWSQFNDSRASWSLNRHISARCGQTLKDTMNNWQKYIPAGQVIPFVLVQTWNDYEEGTALESGLPVCNGHPAPASIQPFVNVRPPAANGK